VNYQTYAAFLPDSYTAGMAVPTSTWWPWRGRSVHIARSVVPDATVRAMVIHGGGGYSAALWPIAGIAAGDGIDVLAPDLPLYGDTVEPDPGGVRYDDWVDLLCDLVREERRNDPRPLILFGASMGGMLAYEVAARTGFGGLERSDSGNGPVAAVVVTCLLDMSDPSARAAATRFAWTGRPARAMLRAVEPVLGRVRLPIRWLADMANMSPDPELSRLCATDPRGGGVSVPLGFLSSWMNFDHSAPESFDAAPVTLVAPAADNWTPPDLSISFLQRISGPTEVVMLENCGHFPVEEPGLSQLRRTVTAVAERAGRQ
jgi:alpha-beta hydrolase superfamily lysophospholipase